MAEAVDQTGGHKIAEAVDLDLGITGGLVVVGFGQGNVDGLMGDVEIALRAVEPSEKLIAFRRFPYSSL